MTGSEIGLVLIVMVLGAAAAVFGLVALTIRVLVGMGRGVGSLLGFGRNKPARPGHAFRRIRGGMICPNPRCGRVEHRAATYCSQCGHSLTRS